MLKLLEEKKRVLKIYSMTWFVGRGNRGSRGSRGTLGRVAPHNMYLSAEGKPYLLQCASGCSQEVCASC